MQKELSGDHSEKKPADFRVYEAHFSGTEFETQNYAIQAK